MHRVSLLRLCIVTFTDSSFSLFISTAMTMDEILSLVRSGGNEERIAGLMLCIKHLHLSNLPPSSLNPAQMDKLKKVITGVEPAFLVRMLRSQSLRPISLVLMNHILACPALVEDISSHVVHIYEAILLAEKVKLE